MSYYDKKGNRHATRTDAVQSDSLIDIARAGDAAAASSAQAAEEARYQSDLQKEANALQREQTAIARESSARQAEHERQLRLMESERIDLEKAEIRSAAAQREFQAKVDWLKDSDHEERLRVAIDDNSQAIAPTMALAIVHDIRTSGRFSNELAELEKAKGDFDACERGGNAATEKIEELTSELKRIKSKRRSVYVRAVLSAIFGPWLLLCLIPMSPQNSETVINTTWCVGWVGIAFLSAYFLIRLSKNATKAKREMAAARSHVSDAEKRMKELSDKCADAIQTHGSKILAAIGTLTESEENLPARREMLKSALNSYQLRFPSKCRIDWNEISDDEFEDHSADLIGAVGQAAYQHIVTGYSASRSE